jgi:CRP/FNR family transcriptional regulator, polysaccharide utilization system transcription regulator
MTKPTVLVINDTKELRQNIVELLTLSGYNTLTAENGKKGLEVLSKHEPDLILCAVAMPKLDGYGVLRAVQNIPGMTNVPFIFLGSKTENKDSRKGMNLGADDYLIKPLNEDLLEVISMRLKKREQIKQQFERKDRKAGAILYENTNFNNIFSTSLFKIAKKVKAKQVIYMEDDPVNFVFYLAKGKVKTFRGSEDGKEMITRLYREGDIFGFVSLFEESRKESCTAIDQSELIALPRIVFLEILESNNDVALKLIKSLSGQLLETGDRMRKLAYGSSGKKIADALIFYARIYQDHQDDFPFDRRDISSLAGVAKESVSRKISYFNNNGLIKVNPMNGNIKIQDSKKLESL